MENARQYSESQCYDCRYALYPLARGTWNNLLVPCIKHHEPQEPRGVGRSPRCDYYDAEVDE